MSDKQPQGHCPWCGAPIYVQWLNDPDIEELNPVAQYSCMCRVSLFMTENLPKMEIHNHYGTYTLGLDKASPETKDEQIVDNAFAGSCWVLTTRSCPKCGSKKFVGHRESGAIKSWHCMDCGQKEGA